MGSSSPSEKPLIKRFGNPVRRTRYPSGTLFLFYFGVSLLKLNIRKKGTLIIQGLLGNLAFIASLFGGLGLPKLSLSL